MAHCAIDPPALRISGYPPGSFPEDNVCPGCDGDLTTIRDTVVARSKPRQQTYSIQRAVRQHVVRCLAYRKTEEILPELLQRYPANPPYDDFPWKDRRTDWSVEIEGVKCIDLSAFRKIFVHTQTCCGIVFASEPAGLEAHFLLEHGLWFNRGLGAAHELFKSGDRQGAAEALGPAVYSWFKREWVADPVRQEGVCEEEYRARWGEQRFAQAPYGSRTDVEVPDWLRDESKPSDTSYFGDAMTYTTPTFFQCCFVCANAKHLPWVGRMHPPISESDHGIDHIAPHLLADLTEAVDILGQRPGTKRTASQRDARSCFVKDGIIVCPDPVCASIGTTFENLLHLTWHLWSRHSIDLSIDPSFQASTFVSEDELYFWLARGGRRESLASVKDAYRLYRAEVQVQATQVALPSEMTLSLEPMTVQVRRLDTSPF